MAKEHRFVAWFLRALGCLDLAASAAVVMPFHWMQTIADAAGIGRLPSDPVFLYLARSGSAMYALYGAILVFISFDPERYWLLIKFLACIAILHGAVLLVIDHRAGMPFPWRVIEGPLCAAYGLAILGIMSWSKRS